MKNSIRTSEVVQLIELFLQENYELRYNKLSKKTEIRLRKPGEEFRPLTDKMTNSIIRRIKLEVEDVTSVKQNVQEYLDSEDICQYDPIQDWLESLPKWDGQNRVAELFSRIPGITTEQIYWCSIWMRSTVAHWMNLDMLHGNECVPTFIGSQGCGKSTFCHRLLPPHLRTYYMDNFNLSNKFDKEMTMTNNLLVNLDELDQIRPSQQAQLKQALSKAKVNGRTIFGRCQQDRMRYASFVATTNNPQPLQDNTGSRRYLCIHIPEGMLIDNESEINYEQLYAQLVTEVKDLNLRYWFTNEETMQIQQANAPYQQEQDLSMMLDACFRRPNEGEESQCLTTKAIQEMLKKQYPQLKVTHALSIQIGMKLKAQGYKNVNHHGCSCYQVIPLLAA